MKHNKKTAIISLLSLPFIGACLTLSSMSAHAIDYSLPGHTSSDEKQIMPLTGKPTVTKEQKNITEVRKEKIANNGFFQEDSDYAVFLLTVDPVRQALPTFMDNNQENDFVLSLSELNMSPEMKAKFPKYLSENKIIGASHLGMWVEDKKTWSGFNVFFQNKKQRCAYSYMNLSLSNGMIDDISGTTEIVNKKPAASDVAGSENTGYVYSITWFGNNEVKTLDCATKSFDPNGVKSVKKLANLLDK
jgi:hypothetical protein